MSILQVLSAKLSPPRRTKYTLVRRRVIEALSEASQYRLTLLQAGAGYGKSTALATFAEMNAPLIWYQITEEDRDPFVFLLHLCYSTLHTLPDLNSLPIPLLENWDSVHGPLPAMEVVFQYLNAISEGLPGSTLLILDDIHLIAEVDEIVHLLDRLISLAPPDFHIILSSRPAFSLPNLYRWRALGQVLTIDQSELAFTPEEIAELFESTYHYRLTWEDVEDLSRITEGWAITLHLIWQSLQSGAINTVSDALTRQTSSLEILFEVLMQEVFVRQPEDMQTFMRVTAPLRIMDVQVCNALREATDSAAMLSGLRHQEMFVYEAGDNGLRYHHIFRQFLLNQSEAAQLRRWHQRAADHYQERGDFDSAIYHFLQAQAYPEAADLLMDYGRILLSMGRLDTLATYLDALPPETLHRKVLLLSFLGDLARLHSRFHEALGWYQEAEVLWRERGSSEGVGRALRGQARVYLDTVNPKRAEELLQQALRLSDGTADREAQARLYLLLAENKLNAGKVEEAEKLQRQAKALQREGPADSQLLIRVLLRTGRLSEAREKLEELVEEESHDPVRTPRSHRETQLLLSIIHAMQGRPEEASQTALNGIRRGQDLGSPFIIAVGYMRQGHAYLLQDDPERFNTAHQAFEKAVQISRKIAIPRLRIEACWGLCQTFGRQGNLREAAQAAQEGLEIATQVGDEWIASLIRLAMGSNHTLAEEYQPAEDWLGQAMRGFQECSDPFGVAVARLWLCLGWYRQNNLEKLSQTLPDVLAACQQSAYDFLFIRPTLLGPFDERSLVPLLILARQQGWLAAYAAKLLQEMGLSGIAHHPGYQLRVQTLGSFQVWRGNQPIPYSGWHRATSRRLFQLLLTYRNAPLDRDQICEHLWPGAEPKVAHRNFKVTLNALYNVLEPQRQPGSESAYILREGTVYGMHPNADIWLDADDFIASATEIRDRLLKNLPQPEERIRQVLALYQGEYLPDTRYETWSATEREHLTVLFLQTADAACDFFLKSGSFDEVLDLCQRILVQDNCWEPAYRYAMQAYHSLGDHGRMARTYHKCVETLQAELDVSPAAETVSLYEQFIS